MTLPTTIRVKADPASASIEGSASLSFRLLAFVAANCLGLNFLVFLVSKWIIRHGWLNWLSLDTGFHDALRFYHRRQGADSWDPMLLASNFFRAHPTAPLYQSVFFESHVKFQYPLSALLPILFLRRHGVTEMGLLILARRVTWTTLWLVAGTAVAIAFKLVNRDETVSARGASLVAVALGSFWFHPVLRSYALGQVQILLTLGFALAFYFWMTGSERLAGVLLGVLSLVKPQYVLLLVWMALRKRWDGFMAGMFCALVGVAISVGVFGWHNNLAYLDVLKMISRHGESYEVNQSMNGLLNRLVFNGQNLLWLPGPSSFPPFRPLVYAGSAVATVLLLGLGLLYPWGPKRSGGMADFSFMAIVATISSPVAWEHHYGIVLPILVWLWFSEYQGRNSTRGVLPIALAYILIGDCLSPVNLLWNKPAANLLQSYTYFGALLLLFLLTRAGSPRKAIAEVAPATA